jgi:NADH:ubiquinone oxidoreductase subunit 6 (subunit J)
MFLTYTFLLIIITLFAYLAVFAILFSIVDFYEKPQTLEALYTFTLIVVSVITLEIIDGFDNEFLFLTLSLIYFGAIIVFYIYVLIQLENKEEKKQKLPFQFMLKNIPWSLLFSTWFLIN